MIPVKLRLHNFMSYRDTLPISFESIHIACISGNNGNGKSALIDAITWALWGQTRANSDDELVHSGQSEVEVDFEFTVNRQNYRILRKHTKPRSSRGAGQTILELQSITEAGMRSLTGDTVTQTQQKIIQLLHMDYDTFINSAFIRQGHADEFTRKRPAERKQVLGSILQLSIYDALENQAREMSKEKDMAILQLESLLSADNAELERKSQYQSELEIAQSKMAVVDLALNEQNQKLAALRKDREVSEAKKSQLNEINSSLINHQKNLKSWSEQTQQAHTQIERYQKLISHRELVEEKYAQLQKTRLLIQDLDQKLKQTNILSQKAHKLELTIAMENKKITSLQAVAASRIGECQKVCSGLPHLQQQVQEIAALLAGVEEAERQLGEQQEQLKKLHGEGSTLRAEQKQCQQILVETAEKLDLLRHSESARCPLCESDLGLQGHAKIEQKYLEQQNETNSRLKSIEQRIVVLENQEKQLEKYGQQRETVLKNQRSSLQNQQGTLSKAMQDAVESQKKLVEEQKVLSQLEEKLNRRQYAESEQKALAETEKEIQTLRYDAQKHEMLRQELPNLEKFESPWHQLAEAEKQIAREQERELLAVKNADEIRKIMEIDSQRSNQLCNELQGYNTLLQHLNTAEEEYRGLVENQKQAQETVGGARDRLLRLTEVEKRFEVENKQHTQLLNQSKIMKELLQAFGKKGLQAMLIEMAIPEIEAEANRLLARMTDNRMFIKLETQRETKKGDVMETLDINISDELGTRNYEMFSGGEAFRIDFAIRIALSKLLARRAGAPLPTLIIDEGFGTQDGTGIEKIKEAITSIQDDFEKILVITHIADFKDAFPVRIEVVKTQDGSSVYLN
jgi:DNA repair protein SbcC/Rad50